MTKTLQLCLISDLHGHLPEIPETDVLIIAGDLNTMWAAEGNKTLKNVDNYWAQGEWLDTVYRAWEAKVPAKHILATWGNWDFVANFACNRVPKDLKTKFLVDQCVVIEGVYFYGTPYHPNRCDWAFQVEETDLAKIYSRIPDNTDVLITHCPPLGILDKDPKGIPAGSSELRKVIDRHLSPKAGEGIRLHVYGHIHSARGIETMLNANNEVVTFANVAHQDKDRQFTGSPHLCSIMARA